MLTSLLRHRIAGDTLAGHAGGGTAVIARNAYVHRSDFWILISGFVEPFLYLLSLGIGLGQLVGRIPYAGGTIDYPLYVAPAMLAAAAMNGALTESTYNVYAKLKFMKLYDGVLATPVTPLGIAFGEIGWAVSRSSLYSAIFVVVMAAMGLTTWWTVLVLPVAVLIAVAFSAAGIACTTYMRTWQDFDYVTMSIFLLLLFSGTFAPIGEYPVWLQPLIVATPLYHGIELVRALTTGAVSAGLLWNVGYLVAVAAAGLAVTGRRMRRLLTP